MPGIQFIFMTKVQQHRNRVILYCDQNWMKWWMSILLIFISHLRFQPGSSSMEPLTVRDDLRFNTIEIIKFPRDNIFHWNNAEHISMTNSLFYNINHYWCKPSFKLNIRITLFKKPWFFLQCRQFLPPYNFVFTCGIMRKSTNIVIEELYIFELMNYGIVCRGYRMFDTQIFIWYE